MSVTSGRAQFGPPGYEVDLLYIACLAALAFGGSGPMALDDYLRKK
jgi:putative oxidoreductase